MEKSYKVLKDINALKQGDVLISQCLDISPWTNLKYIYIHKRTRIVLLKEFVENSPECFELIIDNKNVIEDEFNELYISKSSYEKLYKIKLQIDNELFKRTVVESENNKTIVTTKDGFNCTDGDIIYGIALQASGIDQWREVKLPFKTTMNEARVWFKSKEKANEYLIENKKVFSITDISIALREFPLVNFKKFFIEEAKKRI